MNKEAREQKGARKKLERNFFWEAVLVEDARNTRKERSEKLTALVNAFKKDLRTLMK